MKALITALWTAWKKCSNVFDLESDTIKYFNNNYFNFS